MTWVSKLILFGTGVGSCFVGGLLSAVPADAAERILFYDGVLELELTLADLEAYAQDGQISESVDFILQRIDPDQSWLRTSLSQPYQLSEDPTQNLIQVDRWLTSSQGESLLTRVGDTIRSASRSNNGFYALRAALLSAAADETGLTILNVIEHFPGDTLTVNAQQAPETFAYLNQVAQLTQILGRLQAMTEPDDPAMAADWWLQQAFLSWLQSDDQSTVQQLERSLALQRRAGDGQGEGITLYLLGLLYLTQGIPQEALDYSQQALAQFESIEFSPGEGFSLLSIGNVYWIQGDFQGAIETFERALATHPEITVDDNSAPLTTADLITAVFAEESGDFLPEQLMALGHEAWGPTVTLSSLGRIYRDLGQTEVALDYFQQILQRAEAFSPVDLEAKIDGLKNIGTTYLFSGRPEQALSYLDQAYRLEQILENEVTQLLGGAGLGLTFRPVRDTDTRFYLSIVHRGLRNYEQSLAFGQAYLSDLQSTGQRIQSGGNLLEAQALHSVGITYLRQQDYELANEHFSQALSLYQQLGLTVGEAYLMTHIGQVLAAQEQPELSIAFHKRAVTLIESVRERNQGLELELQQSYGEVVSDIYRDLADLLLQQDRVLEAQQVLDLLKVQELDDYLQNVRGVDSVEETVAYRSAESEVIELHQRAIDQGRELDALRQIERQQTLSPEQVNRREQLVQQEGLLLDDFESFLDHPDVVAAVDQLTRTAQRQNLALEDLNALQDNLRALDQGAVLLYPLILKDRLELVLVTPYAPPVRYAVPVTNTELNDAILSFRRALTNPNRDPIRSAQQLYDWLIAPIKDELDAAGAETLIYAPDGKMRYIPLAALHDGQQWLGQRYRVNHITAASLTDLNTRPESLPTVLAGAFTQGNYQVQIASRQLQFQGLPFAGVEVENLAATIPNTVSLIDGAFSPTATIPQMNSHSIVHLATHAAFVNGEPEDSFILFGNGEKVSLRDIRRWNLSNVDLVVLSACQTALGGQLGNGEEILGFGYQIQRTGARAAIATLWSVDDGGTQVLMNEFYRYLQQGLSKSEALRQAQNSLMAGGHDNGTGRDLSHPFYWAPFILIGNGL